MIKPLGNKIMLEIAEQKFGAVQSEAIEESGKIIDTGTGVIGFEIGKTLYFKAWAVDIITQGENKYYFISADSDAICGISD